MTTSNYNIESLSTQDLIPSESFDALLNFLSKENLDEVILNRNKHVWENIPMIIPQSVLVLEKNLQKIQQWCKVAESQIAVVFSGTLTKNLYDDLQEEKAKSEDFRINVTNELETITKEISEINDIERKRAIKENQERVEPAYFDKFFEPEKEHMREPYEQKHLKMLLEKNKQGEYDEPRRYNLKQLYYIICKLLNQSQLNSKVVELDDELKKLEYKIEEKFKKQYEEMNENFIALKSQIMNEKDDLRQEMGKQNSDAMDYINTKVLPRLTDAEQIIESTLLNVEKLQQETAKNSDFEEEAQEKFAEIIEQHDNLYRTFKTKISFYDENFAEMKFNSEQKLDAFTGIIETKIIALQKDNREQAQIIRNEFYKVFDDYNKRNIENMESVITKNSKQIRNVEFEIRRIEDCLRSELNASNSEYNKKHQELKGKLDSFISRFDTYAKTKIEPAFNNEAKVHALEAKMQEQEEFFACANLFTKDILKKLIYTIQKHNISKIKLSDEEECSKDKKLLDIRTSCQTEVIRDTNASNILETPSNEDVLSVRRSLYPGFGGRKRTFTSTESRRGDRTVYPSMQIEGVNTSISKQIAETLPNYPSSQNRKRSFDLEDSNSKKVEENNLGQSGFDSTLHKRLESLRKALIEETSISQRYSSAAAREVTSQARNTQERESVRKSTVLDFYKDIDMIKVTANGTKRKFSINKVLNQTTNEFTDNHLL